MSDHPDRSYAAKSVGIPETKIRERRPAQPNLGCVNDLGQFLGLLIRQRWLLDGGR